MFKVLPPGGGLRKIDHVHEEDTECHPEASNTKRRSKHFSSQGRAHLTKVHSDPNNLEMPDDLLFLNYQPPWLVWKKNVSLCKKKIETDSVEVEAVNKRVSTTATRVPMSVPLQQLCCWKDLVDHGPLSATSTLGHRKGDPDNPRGVWTVMGLSNALERPITKICPQKEVEQGSRVPLGTTTGVKRVFTGFPLKHTANFKQIFSSLVKQRFCVFLSTTVQGI